MPETITASGSPCGLSGFTRRCGCRFVPFLSKCLLALCLICGCSDSDSRYMDEKVLIRAGDSVVTVRAFHEAFESSIASPSQLFQDPAALRVKKYRILNRLSEELLILERARELDLKITDEESARVIDDLKKDYPDDTFEKTLMENGISFLAWEKALKRRLLMEKVIRHDLSKHSFSTPLTLNENRESDSGEGSAEDGAVKESAPEEIAASEGAPEGGAAVEPPPEEKAEDEAPPVKASVDGSTPGDGAETGTAGAGDSEPDASPADDNTTGLPAPVTAAETRYPEWIKRLERQYAIEIDWKLWEIIVQEQENGV